jgi:hypothetical protein
MQITQPDAPPDADNFRVFAGIRAAEVSFPFDWMNMKMNELCLNRVVAVIFIFLLLLWGCSNDKSDSTKNKLNLKVDKSLLDVSPHAAVIFTSIQMQKDLNCFAVQETPKLLNKSLDDSSQGTKVKMMFNETTESFIKMCKFYNEIVLATNPTFEMIKNDSNALKGLYSFSIFLLNDHENEFTSKEEEIGLFSSLESCEMFEKRAHDLNIPTRKCSLWSKEKF